MSDDPEPMTAPLQRLATARRAVLLTLVFALPLIVSPRWTLDTFPTPKLAFLMIMVGLALGLRIIEFDRGLRLRIDVRVVVAVLLILVPLTLGWLFSPYKEWSLFGQYTRYQGLLPYASLAVLALLIADAFAGQVRPLLWALWCSGSLVALYAVIQYLGFDPVAWPESQTDVAFSTIGNSNFTGGFVALVIPLGFGLWRGNDRVLGALALGFPLALAALVAAHSAGGIGAAIAGTAVTGGLLLGRRWRPAAALGVGVALAVSLVMVGAVTATVLAPDRGDEIGITVAQRGWFWQAAGGMVSDHPLVGRGPDSFAVESSRYRPRAAAFHEGMRQASEPHSVVLGFATSAGAIGTLGFVLLVLLVVHQIVKFTRGRIDPVEAALSGSVTAYFVQSQVSIEDISIRTVFWVTLAALLVARATPSDSPAPVEGGSYLKVAVTATGILVAAGLVVLGSRLVIADHRALHGLDLIATGDFPAGHAQIERALGVRDEFLYRSLYGQALGRLALSREGSAGPDTAAIVEEIHTTFAYLEDHPEVQGLVGYGQALYRWSGFEPSVVPFALDAYERAARVDPHNPVIAIYMSDALISLERPEDAIRRLNGYAPVPAGYPGYWGAMSLANVKAGNLETARVQIAQALDVNPDDPRALQARDLLDEAEQ